MAKKGGLYCHGVCGGSEIQAMGWARLNTSEFVDYDDGDDTYFCETCNGTFEKDICYVEAGKCEFHRQPFEVCRQEKHGQLD